MTSELQETIIKILKNRKSLGIDEITNEIIKYGRDHLNEELTLLFNTKLKIGEIPIDWKSSITVPIFKKKEINYYFCNHITSVKNSNGPNVTGQQSMQYLSRER